MEQDISLYLIRHGESFANTQPHIIGGQSPETILTPLGERQAKRLGIYLDHQGVEFTKVISSPFPRARKTCDLVLEQMGLDPDVEEMDDLVEISQGEWEGKPRSEIYTVEVLDQMNRLGYRFRPPGGESQRDIQVRGIGAIERAILNNPVFHQKPESIAIFNHGHLIKMILQGIMGFSEPRAHRITIENTSITHLNFNSKYGWELRALGATPHLVDLSFLEKLKTVEGGGE